MIRGLIFDCDGTLADTMPLHYQAWDLVTQKHRFLHLPLDRFYSLGGIPSREIVKMLAAEQGLQVDADVIAREKERAYLEQLPLIKPIEEVASIARANRGKLPMAIATGGNRAIMRQVLGHLGMYDWFQAIVTSDDVTRFKPAPDVFLEAARRIGIPPNECRAYEDTELGLQAIRAAGMEAVDVRLLRKMPPEACCRN